jgi:hypothetical protein
MESFINENNKKNMTLYVCDSFIMKFDDNHISIQKELAKLPKLGGENERNNDSQGFYFIHLIF